MNSEKKQSPFIPSLLRKEREREREKVGWEGKITQEIIAIIFCLWDILPSSPRICRAFTIVSFLIHLYHPHSWFILTLFLSSQPLIVWRTSHPGKWWKLENRSSWDRSKKGTNWQTHHQSMNDYSHPKNSTERGNSKQLAYVIKLLEPTGPFEDISCMIHLDLGHCVCRPLFFKSQNMDEFGFKSIIKVLSDKCCKYAQAERTRKISKFMFCWPKWRIVLLEIPNFLGTCWQFQFFERSLR